jgi:membrane-bound lytic murein transglycosylase F
MIFNVPRSFLSVLFIILTLSGCSKSSVDLIKERGYITVITGNSAHGSYDCEKKPSGFEYDLAKNFAAFLGVELRVITPDWEDMEKYLNNSKGDFIAASFTRNEHRKNLFEFSDVYMSVQEQIIVNNANNSIDTIADISGRDVHIRASTSYEYTLHEYKKKGLDFNIIRYENVPTEEFIRQVNDGKIEMTVADSHIARLNRRYYPEIKIACPISDSEDLCWAAKKGNKALVRAINSFFETIEENGVFSNIYEKYYSNTEVFDYVDIKKFHIRLRTRLPKYKKIIKSISDSKNFDWRLIAAIVYQESHFNPRAKSHTGVRGLMQLTLATAGELGVTNRLNPEQSVEGGASYLEKLISRFDKIPAGDRMKFALASYNVGYGHVRDAQKIAEDKGWNANSWAGVSKALPLLRFSRYYKKTKYGYARGTEPVRYVNRIYTYYDIIKNKYKSVAETVCSEDEDTLI